MIVKYKDRAPSVSEDAMVWETACIAGDVTLEAGVSVWHGASIRGDSSFVTVGQGSNVQENATIHTSDGHPAVIGKGVTVGHNAIVHGCTVGDNVLIGMGAIILDGAVIGDNTVIGAGALVSQGKQIPAGSLVIGLPGKVARELDDAEKDSIRANACEYEELMREYRKK